MLPAIDSFYMAVEAALVANNPQRQVLGLLEAQDWPPQEVAFEAFYCLVLGATPLGRQAYSATSPIYVHHLQWVWMIMGTDVQAGIRGRNRGDRYRTNHIMEQELLVGLFPYFAPKLSWTVDVNGNLTGTPYAVPDTILWTPPSFVTRVDKASGLTYGSAAVSLTDIAEQVAAA